MINLIKKKIKFENCFCVLFCILGIIFSINLFRNENADGIRIFHSSTHAIILLILFVVLLLSEIILLIIKKYFKIKRVIYLITIILFTIIIIDKFILGIIRCFMIAESLHQRPTSLDPISIRITYIILKNYKSILLGIWTTLWLSLSGTIVGLLIALVFINLKKLEINSKDNEFIVFIKRVAQCFVDTYVTIFRGTPMMVQAIIIYYFLPGVLSGIFNIDQQVLNNILSVSISGFITVTLNTTAYLTEVLRGGIDSIDKGQIEAARSLGMSRTKAMIYVIMPQGIKNALPAICNEFIINIKDTSVLSVISVMDLFFIINSINKKNASQDGIFIAAIIYLTLTFGISKILNIIEKKMNIVTKPLPSCN